MSTRWIYPLCCLYRFVHKCKASNSALVAGCCIPTVFGLQQSRLALYSCKMFTRDNWDIAIRGITTNHLEELLLLPLLSLDQGPLNLHRLMVDWLIGLCSDTVCYLLNVNPYQYNSSWYIYLSDSLAFPVMNMMTVTCCYWIKSLERVTFTMQVKIKFIDVKAISTLEQLLL